MKRLFAILLWFSFFFQNFAPAIVIAQELSQDEQEQQQEEVISSPEPSSEREDSEEENTLEEQEEETQESPTPSSIPSPVPSPTSSPQPLASPVVGDEPATVSASLTSTPSAQTNNGSDNNSNANDNGSSSNTSTGNAAAVSSTTNVANNTSNGSNVSLVTKNLEGNEGVDLNELWCEEPQPQQSTTTETLEATQSATMHDSLLLNNEASVESTLNVNANSGDNTVRTDGDGTILTGDAIAIANLINLLNSTFIDSQLLVAMLNIWPEFAGDIVVPRPELILGQDYVDQNGESLQFTAEQWAEILNLVSVQANTGANSAGASGGLNEMSTGNAYAAANISNFANLLLQNQGKYGLWINVAADWNGSIFGADEQQTQLAPGLYFFDFGSMLGMQPSNCGELGSSPCMPTGLGIDNTANIRNTVNVSANTGGNTVDAEGNSVIHTGDATAIANVFNMVNSTFIKSQMFFGFVNILGDWTGNIWFAYPDVGVNVIADKNAVELGDTITYTVSYKNGGKDAADDVSVNFSLPNGTEYVSDTVGSGLGNFDVGTLKPGEGGSFQVTVKVTDWSALAQVAQSNTLLSKIIRPAHADSDQREITATARIITSEPQSSTRNDQSIYRTAVYREIEDLESVGGPSEEDLDFYDIALQMEHNVGEYVFPGDVVTFTARIRNENDVDLHNVALMHQIIDENGNVLAELAFPIGNMGARKSGLITFGMQVPNGQLLGSVNIQTRTWVTGIAKDGSPAESSLSSSSFTVRPKALQLPLTTIPGPEVAAGVEASNGEVLGAVSSASSSENRGTALWQALAILLFVFLSVRMLRRLEQRRALMPIDSAF